MELARKLGLFDSTMVVVGNVIGSGIFLTTGIMATYIPSPGWILLAWIGGGLITLTGALTYSELGVLFPEAGGQYVYLKEAYGPLIGFLFGWITFLIYMTGSIAALSVAFSEYLGIFLPSMSDMVSTEIHLFNQYIHIGISVGQLVAVGIILVLSLVNYLGLVLGKTLLNIVTVIKIGALLALVFLGLTLGRGGSFALNINPEGVSFGRLLAGFGVALISVTWAFDGWNNLNFVAGEIKNPRRNLPFALIIGITAILFLYALINIVYLYALPVNEMAGEIRVAEKAVSVLFGTTSGALISIVVLISIFGTLNGSILAAPRVYYSMAKDRLFFKKAAEVHPRFRTPGFAIIAQAVWSSILALSGTFEQLITFVIFISILFWIAGAAAIFTLRRKYPEREGSYKTWGYPLIPMIYILTLSGILINTLFEKPVESFAGIVIMIAGVPVYYFWNKFRRKNFSGETYDRD